MYADCWHPIYAYMNVSGMKDTLIFSHIRRHRANLGFQNFEFQYFF